MQLIKWQPHVHDATLVWVRDGACTWTESKAPGGTSSIRVDGAVRLVTNRLLLLVNSQITVGQHNAEHMQCSLVGNFL